MRMIVMVKNEVCFSGHCLTPEMKSAKVSFGTCSKVLRTMGCMYTLIIRDYVEGVYSITQI